MTRKQTVFIIFVNAIISLIVSLSVVIFVEPKLSWEAEEEPTEVAQATVEPTLPPESTTYVVQSGDSLYGIAVKFGVSAEDIMRANNIVDPDLLFAGQELIIPLEELPPVTPTPTATPIPFEPPTPLAGVTVTPTPPERVAVEIKEAIAPGDYPDEMLILLNSGRPVRLEGWTLSDQDGHTYTFPDLFLGVGGGVKVHTAHGQDTVRDLYWELDTAVWGRGDVATLRDSAGKVMATYTVP